MIEDFKKINVHKDTWFFQVSFFNKQKEVDVL